jgi:hypothetical protein
MQQPKYIPVQKSKLYHLGRKKDFAALLELSLPELRSLTSDANFKEWTRKQGGKNRIIEEPLPSLASALSKLHAIISFVETPSWLLSGKKRVKPRDNAEAHCHNGYMITVDIERFYQSTKREFVFTAFRKFFGHTDDVASLLADLVTYKGHIPTGTATSQIVAFWAYRQTFERIHGLCAANGILMTVWVDDISFSSAKPFPKNWLLDIGKITAEVGLSLKAKKTRKYTPSEYKTVTGSAISPSGQILVKNEKRKELLDLLNGRNVERLPLKETRQLFGKLVSQRQNEPNFFDGIFLRCKSHKQKLERKKRKKDAQKHLPLPFRDFSLSA